MERLPVGHCMNPTHCRCCCESNHARLTSALTNSSTHFSPFVLPAVLLRSSAHVRHCSTVSVCIEITGRDVPLWFHTGPLAAWLHPLLLLPALPVTRVHLHGDKLHLPGLSTGTSLPPCCCPLEYLVTWTFSRSCCSSLPVPRVSLRLAQVVPAVLLQ